LERKSTAPALNHWVSLVEQRWVSSAERHSAVFVGWPGVVDRLSFTPLPGSIPKPGGFLFPAATQNQAQPPTAGMIECKLMQAAPRPVRTQALARMPVSR